MVDGQQLGSTTGRSRRSTGGLLHGGLLVATGFKHRPLEPRLVGVAPAVAISAGPPWARPSGSARPGRYPRWMPSCTNGTFHSSSRIGSSGPCGEPHRLQGAAEQLQRHPVSCSPAGRFRTSAPPSAVRRGLRRRTTAGRRIAATIPAIGSPACSTRWPGGLLHIRFRNGPRRRGARSAIDQPLDLGSVVPRGRPVRCRERVHVAVILGAVQPARRAPLRPTSAADFDAASRMDDGVPRSYGSRLLAGACWQYSNDLDVAGRQARRALRTTQEPTSRVYPRTMRRRKEPTKSSDVGLSSAS